MSIFSDNFEISKRESAGNQYQFVKLYVGDTYTLTLSIPVSYQWNNATEKQKRLVENEVLAYLRTFKTLIESGNKITAYQLIHFKPKK